MQNLFNTLYLGIYNYKFIKSWKFNFLFIKLCNILYFTCQKEKEKILFLTCFSFLLK